MAYDSTYFVGLVNQFVASLIQWVIAAVIILLFLAIGMVAADFVSRLVRKALREVKVEEWIQAKGLGNALAGFTVTQIFSVWLKLYIIFAALGQAAQLTNIRFLSDLIWGVLAYLPSLLQGLIVLVGILFVSSYVTNVVSSHREMIMAKQFALGLKMVFAYIAIVLALPSILPNLQTQINVLQSLLELFLTAIILAFALAFGLGFGLGIKDSVAKSAAKHQELFDRLLGRIHKQ